MNWIKHTIKFPVQIIYIMYEKVDMKRLKDIALLSFTIKSVI